MHGGGWWSYISADPSKAKPKVDRTLLRRVMEYARPYWWMVLIVLVSIIVASLLELVPPLILRQLIDVTLPTKNYQQLNWLALGLIAIPVITGLIDVLQRYYGSKAGEGIIYDLRQQMYGHLQRMSLRFFTHTKSGEIISRFNNDVIGAQNAITGTIPNIVVNIVTLISTLVIMISISPLLSLLSVAVVPLFILPAKRVAGVLRSIRREALEYNGEQNNIITETLGINGVLLVKTFGRQRQEMARFEDFNAKVRDIGVRRAPGGPLVLHGAEPGRSPWHRVDLLGGWPDGVSRYPHHRHDRGLRRLPDPTIRPGTVAIQRSGRVRPIAGELRAGVRVSGSADRDPGQAECPRARSRCGPYTIR